MIFNEKAYDEVFPRVIPTKVSPKKETMLPDDEDDIQAEDDRELETPDVPEEDPIPEEGDKNEPGTGDTAS